MSNAYQELRQRQQEEVNAFPISFAFNQKQLEEGLIRLGLKPTDTDKVCTIYGAGDFMRKEDVPKYRELCKKHKRELLEALSAEKTGEDFAEEMFEYELANHEYIITGDVSDALAACGLTVQAVSKSPTLARALKRAVKAQEQWRDIHG